jgi:hypothetical protein
MAWLTILEVHSESGTLLAVMGSGASFLAGPR